MVHFDPCRNEDIDKMIVNYSKVGVIGAGAMGRGIAQIAAQAGSTVKLFDVQPEAASKARAAVYAQWDKLHEKGRLDDNDVNFLMSNVVKDQV